MSIGEETEFWKSFTFVGISCKMGWPVLMVRKTKVLSCLFTSHHGHTISAYPRQRHRIVSVRRHEKRWVVDGKTTKEVKPSSGKKSPHLYALWYTTRKTKRINITLPAYLSKQQHKTEQCASSSSIIMATPPENGILPCSSILQDCDGNQSTNAPIFPGRNRQLHSEMIETEGLLPTQFQERSEALHDDLSIVLEKSWRRRQNCLNDLWQSLIK